MRAVPALPVTKERRPRAGYAERALQTGATGEGEESPEVIVNATVLVIFQQ